MGSKVQAELGNAAEESLTSPGRIAPAFSTALDWASPSWQSQSVFSFSHPLFREAFLVFPPMRSQMVPEAEMIPTESLLPSKGIPEVIFLLKLQQTGEKYSLFLSPKPCETLLLLSVQVCT